MLSYKEGRKTIEDIPDCKVAAYLLRHNSVEEHVVDIAQLQCVALRREQNSENEQAQSSDIEFDRVQDTEQALVVDMTLRK